jgi:hypothetical protein
LSGLLAARATDRDGRSSLVVTGAIAGGIGGFGGSFAGYHARRLGIERTHLPAELVAVLEDGTAYAIAAVALNTPSG